MTTEIQVLKTCILSKLEFEKHLFLLEKPIYFKPYLPLPHSSESENKIFDFIKLN